MPLTVEQNPRMGTADPVTELFPDALPLDEFAVRLRTVLEPHGFAPGRALLMVGTCRDELCFPLVERLQDDWGSAFQLGSLGGLLLLGRTGLAAAQNHAPEASGLRRYVVVALAHLGIDAQGRPGQVRRPGQDEASATCGALIAFQRELASGRLTVELDPDDLEQSLLRQRLVRSLRYGEVPDPVGLTLIARDAIMDDLAAIAGTLAGRGPADVAAVGGVLVHGPDGDWVAPHRASLRHGVSTVLRPLAL